MYINQCYYFMYRLEPPPLKKRRINDSEQNVEPSSSACTQHNINEILSQDILTDHAKLLYLLQCFQETGDHQLCKDLVKMIYKEKDINLENQILNSHHIASLGYLLLKPNYKWKRVNLANCHIGKKGICQLHQYFCARTADRSTVGEINLSWNVLAISESSFLADMIDWLQPLILVISLR